ncbi:MAG: beta-N-acetylhexosaminidase [Treponema sp.]|jgi:hexosaminidase|nr:beta-N-acetylhexosaminidase [Treponema sp.]
MNENLSLIPRPVSVKTTGSFFRSPVLPVPEGDTAFRNEIETFKEQTTSCTNRRDAQAENGKKITLVTDKSLGVEAYVLEINPQALILKAASPAGAYHGLQSIRELVLSSRGETGIVLPCAEIVDYPRFPWRGFMLDCSRYFYRVEFIKKIIDALSLHHINVFHWHLTDDQGWRLPVQKYPLLTEIGSRRLDYRSKAGYSGGFYSREEIRGIVDYAASRHVEIVPEVDLPGHTSSVLAAYPGLGCTGGPYRVEDRFGIFEEVLCAGNDGIFDLAEAVFDTLAELFPSPWVHIGGDEVRFNRWDACPKCKQRIEEAGLTSSRELQSWITVKFARMLSERGKTAIGWDEILEDSERYRLPEDAAVMSWRGREGGLRASRLGHRVVMSPNTEGCYFDYRHYKDPEEPGRLQVSTVYQCYNMDPAGPELTEDEVPLILGGQGNLWSELIYAGKIAEYMIFPRLCALAEALWTPRAGKNFTDFTERLPVHRERLDGLGLLQYRGPLG